MRRVLLDHCVPRPFRDSLQGCQVATALEMGWQALKNGELLTAAEAAGIEILVTADKSPRYQQRLAGRQIAIIELPTNRLRVLTTYAAQVNAAIAAVSAGEYWVISA